MPCSLAHHCAACKHRSSAEARHRRACPKGSFLLCMRGWRVLQWPPQPWQGSVSPHPLLQASRAAAAPLLWRPPHARLVPQPSLPLQSRSAPRSGRCGGAYMPPWGRNARPPQPRPASAAAASRRRNSCQNYSAPPTDSHTPRPLAVQARLAHMAAPHMFTTPFAQPGAGGCSGIHCEAGGGDCARTSPATAGRAPSGRPPLPPGLREGSGSATHKGSMRLSSQTLGEVLGL